MARRTPLYDAHRAGARIVSSQAGTPVRMRARSGARRRAHAAASDVSHMVKSSCAAWVRGASAPDGQRRRLVDGTGSTPCSATRWWRHRRPRRVRLAATASPGGERRQHEPGPRVDRRAGGRRRVVDDRSAATALLVAGPRAARARDAHRHRPGVDAAVHRPSAGRRRARVEDRIHRRGRLRGAGAGRLGAHRLGRPGRRRAVWWQACGLAHATRCGWRRRCRSAGPIWTPTTPLEPASAGW